MRTVQHPVWARGRPARYRALASALLLIGLASAVFWLSLRLGMPGAQPSLYTPEGLPLDALYLCSNAAWSSLEDAPRRAILQIVGMGLLIPLPFLLVGGIAYRLYRSSHNHRRSEWEF